MSIADKQLPIWMRPEPGGRKPRFTREAIAKAALAIADAAGFDAVSMRRIAERLGAGTMTLYHYVRTKAELVALMDDALMGEIVLPEGALPHDWREALTAIARRTREVFRRHPWALVSMQGAIPGPNGARHFEQCLAALSRTSFDRRTKLDVLALVDDFVFGHVLRAAEVQSTLSKEPDAEVLAAIREWGLKQYETGAFPHTQAFFGRAPAERVIAEVAGADDTEGRFERGLATLSRWNRAGSSPAGAGPTVKGASVFLSDRVLSIASRVRTFRRRDEHRADPGPAPPHPPAEASLLDLMRAVKRHPRRMQSIAPASRNTTPRARSSTPEISGERNRAAQRRS